MWFWIAPVIISYTVFTFVAEHINPFRVFREVTARRRIKSGRKAGLIALLVCSTASFGSQFLIQKLKTNPQDDTSNLVSLALTTRTIADPEVVSVLEWNATLNSQEASGKLAGLTQAEATAGAGSTVDLSPGNKTENAAVTENAVALPDAQAAELSVQKEEPAYQNVASKSARWINSQNPKNFTLQVNASFDRASVEAFLVQSELAEPNAIFAFDRNGTTWYALIYGKYESFSSAEAARAQLPQHAKLHNPWVRQFENVHKILKSPTQVQ